MESTELVTNLRAQIKKLNNINLRLADTIKEKDDEISSWKTKYASGKVASNTLAMELKDSVARYYKFLGR